MCPFTIGQEVICIRDVEGGEGYGDEQSPHCGHLYTIRDIVTEPDGFVGLLLVEVRNKARPYRLSDGIHTLEPSFLWKKFRPLNGREEALKAELQIRRQARAC